MFYILLSTVSYLKLNFKLKIDPKICTLKTLRNLKNPEKIEKTSGNPVDRNLNFKNSKDKTVF